jgi:hypothetical protein
METESIKLNASNCIPEATISNLTVISYLGVGVRQNEKRDYVL